MKNLDLLVPTQQPRQTDKFTWATVEDASPLSIRLDGDDDALPSPPVVLTNNLRTGQRVWVQLSGHQVIVHSASKHDCTPAGVVHDWGGSSAKIPAGYLPCQGQTLLIADYPELFDAIGTTNGGNGTTNFMLPDARDRAAVGASDTKAAGSKAGSATKTLTEANLPAHSHGMDHTHSINHDHAATTTSTAGAHNHAFNRTNGGTGGSNNFPYGATTLTAQSTGGATTEGNHTHTVDIPTFTGNSGGASTTTTGSTGSGTAVDVQNPYIAFHKIIKT